MSRTKETTINPSKWGLKWGEKIRERTLTQIWSLKNEELGVIFSWRIGQMGKKVMWELLIFKNWIWLSNVHKNNAGKWSMIGWSASICCWHWILLVKEQPKSVNSEYSRPLSSLVSSWGLPSFRPCTTLVFFSYVTRYGLSVYSNTDVQVSDSTIL